MPNRNSTDHAWINSIGNCSSHMISSSKKTMPHDHRQQGKDQNSPDGSLYRICGTGGAYGRLLTTNASVLQYEHVETPTGRISDRWAITKH